MVAGDEPMTRTTLRKAPFQDFRKPAFAALMLSATMLAGCATNRTPQFSYDADVPSSPVVPAAVTDDRPRPLHTPPAWTVARGGTSAGTPAGRVENANAAARVVAIHHAAPHERGHRQLRAPRARQPGLPLHLTRASRPAGAEAPINTERPEKPRMARCLGAFGVSRGGCCVTDGGRRAGAPGASRA